MYPSVTHLTPDHLAGGPRQTIDAAGCHNRPVPDRGGRHRSFVAERFDAWKRRPVTNDSRLLIGIVSAGLVVFFLFYVAKGPTAGDRLAALALALASAATAAYELWEAKRAPAGDVDVDRDEAGAGAGAEAD